MKMSQVDREQLAVKERPSKRHKTDASNITSQAVIACQRCRSRKIRCDDETPRCSGCKKNDVECIIVDSFSEHHYTRSQIHEMQEKIHQLETVLDDTDRNDDPIHPQRSNLPAAQPITAPESSTVASTVPRYLGEESGIEFIKYMLNSIGKTWKNPSTRSARSESFPEPNISYIPPHELPSRSDAKVISGEYFREFHVQHPIICRVEFWQSFNDIFDLLESGTSNKPDTINKSDELFKLNMVLALGSVSLFRNNQHNKHPFGYFTAALAILSSSGFCYDSLKDIQNFLLIARFGIYYFIGCSIWELCQICIKICMELGMQRSSTSRHITALEEQMRRRVFWECYVLDRLSSTTLGRPFGISDTDTTIGLPFSASEEVLLNSGLITNASFPLESYTTKNSSEMTWFIHHISLARLSSAIHVAMHSNPAPKRQKPHSRLVYTYGGSASDVSSRPGEIYVILQTYIQKLHSWWMASPSTEDPSCLYQTKQWFEFQYHREKLNLIRTAIDRIPRRQVFPPRQLLAACCKSALAVIRVFNEMKQMKLVTYTRTVMQLIFSASLSVIFSIFGQADNPSPRKLSGNGVDVDGWWADLQGDDSFGVISPTEAVHTLTTASDIMSWMATEMTDLEKYVQFINDLRKELEHFVRRHDILGPPKSHDFTNRQQNSQQAHGSVSMGWNLPTGRNHEENDGDNGTLTDTYVTRPADLQRGSHINDPPTDSNDSSAPFMLMPNIMSDDMFDFDNTLHLDFTYDIDQITSIDSSLDQLDSWPFSQIPIIEQIASKWSDYSWDLNIP